MSPVSSRRATARTTGSRRGRPRGPATSTGDSRQRHIDWLSLVDVTGPFLTVPVLTRVWPDLDSVEAATRDALRLAHATRDTDPAGWITSVHDHLLGWGEAVRTEGTDRLLLEIAEHDASITPSYTLVGPGGDRIALLGLTMEPGTHPTARIPGDPWAATPADRAALLCRHHDVPLALVSDGRWWALVWAPRGGVTTVAVFDSITWTEAADRLVVRAFASLLHRRRFFGVPADQTLPALLAESLDNQEEVTEALGAQVRRAVELLVDAIARHDLRRREAGDPSLADVEASEVYRAAVSIMMRMVFLLFAEERGLLPADNPVYAAAYSAGGLCGDLEARVSATGSQEELEHTTGAWRRLLALFTAVYHGISHHQTPMPAYDGALFAPSRYSWLAGVSVDDRTVLHMLTAVQYVTLHGERRRLSFRNIDVEQIGYVYEGLLAYDGYRADQPIVGLIGSKPGQEAKVTLRDLERLADDHPNADADALGAALAAAYKDNSIGTARALAKALAPVDGPAATEALRRLLAATGGDRRLAGRLLPFIGILRDDLRGLPTVIRPSGFYIDASPLRRNTGTHYTPSFLAAQVAEGALEPLVYDPGPLQTTDRTQWRPQPSSVVLNLKIADIAVGSGAFLVAACRYLAERLVEAWSVEGHLAAKDYLTATERPHNPIDTEADPVIIEARREIVQHCLYGVDINPMAVEMAKLSLWLVTMDPTRPFTFLDDRVIAGDSLLGVTSVDQIQAMHPDPAKGRAIHGRYAVDYTTDIRDLIAEIANDRRKLAGLPANDLPAIISKQQALAAVEAKTTRARLFADLTVGAALAGALNGERGLRDCSKAAAGQAHDLFLGTPGAEDAARRQADRWLATDLPDHAFARHPLHWPLAFPEVFQSSDTRPGGFDAIIGNPPFVDGQDLTGSQGTAFREYLIHCLGHGTRGSANLIAYFFLRAHDLLSLTGQTGLIATDTIAQGTTCRVGLDQILASGTEIRQAIKSEKWPSRTAKVRYGVIWTSRAPIAATTLRDLDGNPVKGITSSLDPVSRVSGPAQRLQHNSDIAFQGSIVLGLGFTMEPQQARALIKRDPRNADVLFPYLNGKDLNQRPDCSASRWVIDFHNWPQDRAATYPECFDQVERLVKPERDQNTMPSRRDRWWQYAARAGSLYVAIAGLDRVVVITQASKTVMPVMVRTGLVFDQKVVVFATADPAMLGVLSSAPHYWWVIRRAPTLGVGNDPNYSPTDVFEKFALPELTDGLRAAGDRLDTYRRELMLARRSGLTDVYKLVHNPQYLDADIVELRRIHVAIDEAVVRAYGWNDLLTAGLDHGFHDTRQGIRYTVGPTVRQEILDRLLELNHERYAEEQRAPRQSAVKRRGGARSADSAGVEASGGRGGARRGAR